MTESPDDMEAGKELMQATVKRVEYDFVSFTGRVYMAAGDCTDMSACIHYFRQIDPNVICIRTFSGTDEDTMYRLIDNEWRAYR